MANIDELKEKLNEVVAKFERQIGELNKAIAELKAENAKLLGKQNEEKKEEKIINYQEDQEQGGNDQIYILPDGHRLPPELLCELAKFLPWKGAKSGRMRGKRGQIGRLNKKKNHADLLLANSSLTSFLLTRFNARNKKDKKMSRKRKSTTQNTTLENVFATKHYVSPEECEQMAGDLGLTKNQVQYWFTNRRTKQLREIRALRGW